MKKALIIGLNGNFGSEMARAFKQVGWSVDALMRDPSKAPSDITLGKIHEGDVRNPGAVLKAADGCDVIVYAAHPAYHRWHEEAMGMLEPVVQAAQSLGIRILFPGNVYNFAPQATPISEMVAPNPPTDKGDVRVRMEARLQQAAENGAKVTIIRAGDFIGPKTQFTWLDLMLKGKGDRYTMRLPHAETGHVHYWSYLPDTCLNAAMAMALEQADFEVFHDPGLALTAQDWQKAIRANGFTLKTASFPWWALRMASLFNATFREVLKMRYLWRENVVMDGSKLKNALGDSLVSTSLTDIVASITSKESGADNKQLEAERRPA